MKYKIFELIGEEKLEEDGFDTKTIQTYKLKETSLNSWGSHVSFQDAEKHIEENAKNLNFCKMTILPIYEIDYEGNIR